MGVRQKLYVECVDVQTRDRYIKSALGLQSLFGRWEMLPAEESRSNERSFDIEIPDFRGQYDIDLIKSLPGVVKVDTFHSERGIVDPLLKRRQILNPATAVA